MTPVLWFVHGWGFDASVFDALAKQLQDWPQDRYDAGYFGESNAAPAEPFIAVVHSFGMMRVLKALPEHCIGIVCLNGFARFTAAPDFPAGTPARLVDRMATRLRQDAVGVVTAFRARCGVMDADVPAPPEAGLERLARDLAELRDGDERAALAACRVPIVALAAADDPIVPPAMTDLLRADRPDVELSMLADGGHLLPVTRPEACAAAVRRLVAMCTP